MEKPEGKDKIFIDPEQKAHVKHLLENTHLPLKIKRKFAVLLSLEQGIDIRTISSKLNISSPTIYKYKQDYEQKGLWGFVYEYGKYIARQERRQAEHQEKIEREKAEREEKWQRRREHLRWALEQSDKRRSALLPTPPALLPTPPALLPTPALPEKTIARLSPPPLKGRSIRWPKNSKLSLQAGDRDKIIQALSSGKLRLKLSNYLTILLKLDEGLSANQIADFLGITPETVYTYGKAYLAGWLVDVLALLDIQTQKPDPSVLVPGPSITEEKVNKPELVLSAQDIAFVEYLTAPAFSPAIRLWASCLLLLNEGKSSKQVAVLKNKPLVKIRYFVVKYRKYGLKAEKNKFKPLIALSREEEATLQDMLQSKLPKRKARSIEVLLLLRKGLAIKEVKLQGKVSGYLLKVLIESYKKGRLGVFTTDNTPKSRVAKTLILNRKEKVALQALTGIEGRRGQWASFLLALSKGGNIQEQAEQRDLPANLLYFWVRRFKKLSLKFLPREPCEVTLTPWEESQIESYLQKDIRPLLRRRLLLLLDLAKGLPIKQICEKYQVDKPVVYNIIKAYKKGKFSFLKDGRTG